MVIVILVTMTTLFSCKTIENQVRDHITTPIQEDLESDTVTQQGIDSISPIPYNDLKKLYEYPYEWISYRAKVAYTFNENEGECNLYYVNKIDSIIYLNINISGIEVVRIVFTPSQVTYVNKLNKTFYKGDYFFIERIASVPLNFNNIQSIFNGKDFANYQQNFKISIQNDTIIMYSQERKNFQNRAQIQQTLIVNKLIQLIQNRIYIESISKKLDIDYFDYSQNDTIPLFQKLKISSNDFDFNLELKNIKFNIIGPTSITIPESFTPVTFQPKL